MKNLFRILALTAAVSASMISNAHAGFCSIRCGDGSNHSYPASSGYECCQTFYNVCNFTGHASYDGEPCAI